MKERGGPKGACMCLVVALQLAIIPMLMRMHYKEPFLNCQQAILAVGIFGGFDAPGIAASEASAT